MPAAAQYKRPESILLVVYTRQGEVLLLNRVRPAGFWQSVTGSLEWGEQPRQAAVRELAEETGIHSQRIQDCHTSSRFPILPEWRHRYAADVHENIEHVFRLELEARQPVTLNPQEHSQYEWLPISEAADRVFSWTNRDAILALD